MKSENPLVSILAPAYNEEDNIERVIRSWEEIISRDRLDAEIIVVNDGSTDKTGEILERLMKEFPDLKGVSTDRNLGYGGALLEAVAKASGKYSITIDSDGQFDLEDYRPMLEMMKNEKLDAVTGRRAEKKDKKLLVAADRGLNSLVRLLFRVPFRDTNCAVKMYRTRLLRAIPLRGKGWTTPTELLIRAHKGGARVGEMEVRHYPRPAGESKLNPLRVGMYFLVFLLYLRIELLFKIGLKIMPGEE